MNPQEPSVRRVSQDSSDSPLVILLRKIEFLFYLIFVLLALVCVILPYVYNVKLAPLYLVAGMSVLYAIGLYFLRFKIYVHFGLMFHIGVFLILFSTIFYEIKLDRAATAMVIIGLLSIALVIIYLTLGKPLIIRHRNRQQDQPRQGVRYLANQPLEADEDANPVFPNGDINHHNLMLPNDIINPAADNPEAVRANGPQNFMQDVPNDPAVQARDFPPDHPEPHVNEPAVQQGVDLNKQAVQVNKPDVDERENLNEHIVPEREEQQ